MNKRLFQASFYVAGLNAGRNGETQMEKKMNYTIKGFFRSLPKGREIYVDYLYKMITAINTDIKPEAKEVVLSLGDYSLKYLLPPKNKYFSLYMYNLKCDFLDDIAKHWHNQFGDENGLDLAFALGTIETEVVEHKNFG